MSQTPNSATVMSHSFPVGVLWQSLLFPHFFNKLFMVQFLACLSCANKKKNTLQGERESAAQKSGKPPNRSMGVLTAGRRLWRQGVHFYLDPTVVVAPLLEGGVTETICGTKPCQVYSLPFWPLGSLPVSSKHYFPPKSCQNVSAPFCPRPPNFFISNFLPPIFFDTKSLPCSVMHVPFLDHEICKPVCVLDTIGGIQ